MTKSFHRVWLIVCTLMFGLMNAQADVQTKTIDFEDENAVFTARSRATLSVINDADLNSKVLYMKCADNAQNGYSLANLNLVDLFPNIDRAAKVNVKMRYWSANGSRAILFLRDATLAGESGDQTGVAKNVYGTKYAWFRFGSDKNNGFVQNSASGSNLTKCTGQWLDMDLTVDVEANTVDYTVKDDSGETLFSATGDQPYSAQAGAAVPVKCSQIELWGFINSSDAFKIDNVQITVTASDAEYAAYTVKYVDANGTEIAEARTAEGEVSKAASLFATDKNPIYNEGKTAKYIYVSDNAAETVVNKDGSSVVTVTFREAAVYNFKAEDASGRTLYNGSGFEGDEVNYYIPYYFLDDNNNLYVKPKSPQYGQGTVVLDENNKVVTLTYTLDETNNAVFYTEAEDISTLTPYEDQYTIIRMSSGKAAYAAEEGAVVATLKPGKYTITAATRAGETKFYMGDSEVLTITSTGSVVTETSSEIEVLKKTNITVSAGNNKNYFDYLLIRKTGDVEAIVYPFESEVIESTDVLTADKFTATQSKYTDFSNVTTDTSDAIYAGNSAKSESGAIQLRSTSNAGIVSTTSGGKVKKVVVTWNSETADTRTLDVYGSNTAYTAASDLYNNNTRGTKLGSIVKGTSTELEIEGDYQYVGLRSNSGAMYIDKIEITWSNSASEPVVTAPVFSVEHGTYNEVKTVEITAEDGADIYYVTDDEATLSSKATKYTAPITVDATTTIRAFAVKNDDGSVEVKATYTIDLPTVVATVAELNQLADKEVFTFTGDAVVVANPTEKYLFIKDATANSLIYKGAGGLAFDKGVHLASNWSGSVSIYNGLFEAVPSTELTATEAAPEEITYPEVKASDFIAENVNKVVTLKGVTYTAPEEGNKNFTITADNATVAGYNQFAIEIAAPEANKTYDIVGAIGIYAKGETTTIQLQPISITAVIPSAISNVKADNALNGAIINLQGQKVNANFKGVVIKNGKKMIKK